MIFIPPIDRLHSCGRAEFLQLLQVPGTRCYAQWSLVSFRTEALPYSAVPLLSRLRHRLAHHSGSVSSETKDDMIEKPTLTSREGRWHHLIPSLLKYRPRILRPGNHPHDHDIVSEAQTPIPFLFLALFLASSPSPEDSPLKIKIVKGPLLHASLHTARRRAYKVLKAEVCPSNRM